MKLLAVDVPVEWSGRLLAGVRLPAATSPWEPAELAAGHGPTRAGGLDGIIDDL